jgi:hypothetical protein
MRSRREHTPERKVLVLLFSSGRLEEIRLKQEAVNRNANYDPTKERGQLTPIWSSRKSLSSRNCTISSR